MNPKILREDFDRLTQIVEGFPNVNIEFVTSNNMEQWAKHPKIEIEVYDEDPEMIGTYLKITGLDKKILQGIKSQNLVLDTEMMKNDDLVTLINAGITKIKDANQGNIDLMDFDLIHNKMSGDDDDNDDFVKPGPGQGLDNEEAVDDILVTALGRLGDLDRSVDHDEIRKLIIKWASDTDIKIEL